METANIKKIFVLIPLLSLLFTFGCSSSPYDPSYSYDPYSVLDLSSINHTQYLQELSLSQKNISIDLWATGDYYLLAARMTKNITAYGLSCTAFELFQSRTPEEEALRLETLGSLNCNNKQYLYYENAARIWEKEEVYFRAALLQGINQHNLTLQFNLIPLVPTENYSTNHALRMGTSYLEITSDDIIITQVDRVYRDWLGREVSQNPFSGELLSVFSEKWSYNESALRSDIGWHEGGRLKTLQQVVGITPSTAVGTIVVKRDEKWYAPNEEGIFMFEVLPDKVMYPTTRFLTPDIGVIIDTHGVSALVEQAIRKNATVVVGCCDFADKVKAAVYLSERNISVLCFTDRFVYRSLGKRAPILGSPPETTDPTNHRMTYGNRSIILLRNQKLIVSDASESSPYGLMYYNAPALYFTELNRTFPLDITFVQLYDFHQLENVFERARQEQSSLVATRIFSSDDYTSAKQWLSEDQNHTLILFHSASYPYGQLIFREFPEQTSFDDPNLQPVFI